MPVMKQLRIGSETYDTVGEASVTQVQTSGTKIATVTIDGTATDLYAPEGGSSVDPATTAPSMDGTAAVGTSAKYAREDHVHPHDTSKQDTLVSGTNIKTINGSSLLGSGDVTTPTYTLPAATTSTLGGVKVGSGLSVAADGTLSSDADAGMVVLEYGVSTWADLIEAITANRLVYCRVGQRMAFLAYLGGAAPIPTTLAEFQYYRSVSSHTDSQQGDEVYVYTLRSDNSWTTVTRQASTRVVAGDGLSSAYSNGTITLSSVGGGSGGIADGSVTTAKLADGAVTIQKLSDEANALKEVFAGLHIEKSQSYSSYYTYNVDVYVPKGAVCSITNNSDTNSNIGVHYNGVSTQFGTGLPAGTTFRFIAENTVTRVWQYTEGGTLNAFAFDVQPMWLGDEVESLEQRFIPENLFNPDAEGVQSGWIHTDTGAITASGSWSTSDYIPIEVGKTYSHLAAVSHYGAGGAKRVPCFDAEKNWVGYFYGTIDANNILTFTVPSRLSDGTGGGYRYNHVYARFTYSNANKNKVMFVEGAQPSEYVAYGAGKLATNFGLNQKQKDEVVELVGNSTSPLYGKKIAYNGDSICESRLNTSSLAYNGGAYAKIISDITGCTYENRAHSGGILASTTGDGTTAARYVVSDVENMASDADLICFEGGINDYWTKVPLGTYSESDYTGTLDTTTICGALESIFRQATAKWVGKPICFVIVHKITSTVYTQNTQGYTFKDAHDMMLGICKKYAIPVFDAFEESGLNAYNSIQNTNFLTANANGTPDGCHPNEAGYRAFYVPQLIALFESLIART